MYATVSYKNTEPFVTSVQFIFFLSISEALHLWSLHPSGVSIFLSAGNGLFLFQMARNWEASNFLGLEMNEKVMISGSLY